MSSQARKPYLGLKDSLVTFFERPTRYIKESNMKESVFEKPYWDGEYPSMHLDIPAPDWPTWRFDPGHWKRRGGAGGGLPVANCPGCALYADPTFDCEHDPVEIHAGIYCTNTPGAATDRVLTQKAKISGVNIDNWSSADRTIGLPYGVAAGDTTLQVYAEVGAIKNVTIGQWAFIGPSAAVYVDPNISEHTICGYMVDGAGSQCTACTDVSCCGCDNPPVAFSIASYDSTIDPGGSAYVTVTGGCGPYSYSVVGTGYTAAGVGLVGTITSASGTCGVNYSPYATVTASDKCGTTKSCIIRNTGGKWDEQCTYGTAGCGYDEPVGCISCGISEFWVYGTGADSHKAWKAFSYACRDAGCSWSGGSCDPLGAPKPAGECSTPYT